MKRLSILAFLICPVAFAGTAATTPATADTPLSACKTLVQATVKKDFEGVKKLSMGMPSHGTGKGQAAGFEKMHKEYLSKLENLNCTSEVVANDHAFVQAEAQGSTRLVPFVKTEGGWKFDGKTYSSFYGGAHHGNQDGKGKM